MIKKIVFFGDMIRVNEKQQVSDNIVNFVYLLFSKQIEKICDCKVSVCLFSSIDIFDAQKFMELSGYSELSRDNWISVYNGNVKKESLDYFRKCFQDSVLIFQEAGAMRNVAEKAGVAYIDMFISSLRFLEDLHWAMRSNIEKIRNKINNYRVAEEEFYYQAQRVKSYYWCRGNGAERYNKNSLLLCGQTEVDLSLIKDGNLKSFFDYEKQIRKLFDSYDTIYYKPHPYCKPNSMSEQFIRSFSNVKIVNDNFYKMISNENISAVAALSSGVLKEAPYFGKKIYTISHPFITYYKGEGSISKDDFIIINQDCYSPHFWRDVLSPIINTKEAAQFSFCQKHNFLRELLGLWWGYEIGNISNNVTKSKASVKKGKSKLYKFFHLYWLRGKK